MSLATASLSDSAFVPHDIAAPIAGASTGPLAGLSVVVKDVFDIEGERTGAGNPRWLATHDPARSTASAVRRLLEAGATVTGKTVCDELVYSLTGANAHYGTPVNPRAQGCLPGARPADRRAPPRRAPVTSGSAATPAARPASPRPSVACTASVRPTGASTAQGPVAMAPSFDTVGWLAPSAGLLLRVGGVLLTGPAVDVQVDRVLVPSDLLGAVDPAVRSNFDAFLARVATHLPDPEPVVLAPEGIAGWVECFRVLQAYETWGSFGAWVLRHQPALGPGIDERMRLAAQVTAGEADRARAACATVRARLRELVAPATVLLVPTTPSPAPPLDATPEDLQRFRSRTMALTCIAGLGGLPQVSLPACTVDGKPMGLSLVGWPGGDEAVLELTRTLAVHCGR